MEEDKVGTFGITPPSVVSTKEEIAESFGATFEPVVTVETFPTMSASIVTEEEQGQTIETTVKPVTIAMEKAATVVMNEEKVGTVESTPFEQDFEAIDETVDAVESNSVPSDGEPTINMETDSNILMVYFSNLTS
jgi:hypothetical protein